jgi:hypothetical protein
MPRPNLRIVSRPPRPSVIVDPDRGQKMTPPWSVEDIEAMRGGPIPHAVYVGMWVTAWARAEHCGLLVAGGCLEPHCRYTPSDELYAALGQAMRDVVGVLGFGVPIMVNRDTKRAWAASWPMTFAWVGDKSGRN